MGAGALESKMESSRRAGREKSLYGNGLLQGSIPPAPAKRSAYPEIADGWGTAVQLCDTLLLHRWRYGFPTSFAAKPSTTGGAAPPGPVAASN